MTGFFSVHKNQVTETSMFIIILHDFRQIYERLKESINFGNNINVNQVA